ncbi:HAMP domain-containing sensor histidine kinase [Winogradskyella sp.]|uniref:sensor histidine kinase n=1 Tax=Winogradskyella sp. TaxID=1883156 RepID=UPI00262E1929|nr:HAMP domain-containing sensor histidine kinase [Winogradskyella sp.]
MNNRRYQWILYAIVAVIAVTIGIQVFWNYKNYKVNKQQLINDVQISLDKAVDDYYANLAERTTLGISIVDDNTLDSLGEDNELTKFLQKIDETTNKFGNLDSIKADDIHGIKVLKGRKADSMMTDYKKALRPVTSGSLKLNVDQLRANDSFHLRNIKLLTSKVFVSISNDTLNIKAIDSLLKNEFNRKNIDLKSKLTFYESGGYPENPNSLTNEPNIKHSLSTTSKSTFLPKGSTLKIDFANATGTVLKRSLSGILISTILVLAVISCLFYLLKIIRHQKQLAEVKNDLISNITHEFKTPIATIGVALESINNFNGIDDKEKTKKYINMSSEQLSKLNLMVEKLLETATLDSDNLELNKETVDVVSLINDLIDRYRMHYKEKKFNSNLKVENLEAKVDIFHFENALNNILDNAVKYGGSMISIDLIPKQNSFEILISDSGTTLSKANKDRIFEKFYRVPKGNTHDVKGFGIGLYYTKTIIEKHGGSISLDLTKHLTTFKITLPNG